jgi:hypothetical protein
MKETLLHHDGCHHRVMDIAVVAIGSRLGEGKAKAVSGREKSRIESALVSSDGMGDRILVCPGQLRARLYREGQWTEGKVHDRDAVSSASRRVGGSCRRRVGGSCRRRVGGGCRRRVGGSCRRRVGGGCRGRSATGSQEHNEAHSQQAQPGFCGGGCIGLLHFSSSTAMLWYQHSGEFSLAIRTYVDGLHGQ